MCLEFFNPLLGLPFGWLALALLAVAVAALAALYLFTSPKKDADHPQSSGFTCPCHAPPVAPPEKEAE
jgi:hypothetical protein